MNQEILVMSMTYPAIAEGKTKNIFTSVADASRVFLAAKDDITAGDGEKHDVIEGKAKLATQTTCNVFHLLKACGIPVAFDRQINDTAFEAPGCTMLPYEVVVRREAHGSYLDRNPHLEKGHLFPQLLIEFFLKTKGKKWVGKKSKSLYQLPKDDPLMQFDHDNDQIRLFYPGHTSEERQAAQKGALVDQKPFRTLSIDEVFSFHDEKELLGRMGDIARKTFLVLEKAWQIQGKKLVDFKVEFGIGPYLGLLLADVIDSDSWRVIDVDGGYMDKQLYRDSASMDKVTEKFRLATELTGRFNIPPQQILLWRGSGKDDVDPFHTQLHLLFEEKAPFKTEVVTCSAHKQPVRAHDLLQSCLAKTPDTVIIAYIGRSNGAGPMLAANCTVPVITAPADKKFPDDVWSSLRMPSNVPVMTVLEPANAVLAALQILGMRNPAIYAALRFEQEKRMTAV